MIPPMARGDMLFAEGMSVLKDQMIMWRARKGDLVDRLDSTAYLIEMFGFDDMNVTNLDKEYEEEIQALVNDNFWGEKRFELPDGVLFNNKKEPFGAQEDTEFLYEGMPY